MIKKGLIPKNAKGFILGNSNGFTLLEVMLFLAISSGLAVIAFVGLGPRLRNVRFTDATRGLQANIQSNFSNAELGASQRQTGKKCTNSGGEVSIIDDSSQPVGSAEACVIVGRAAQFESTKVTYRDIVALRKPKAGCPGSASLRTPDEIISCFSPYIVDSGNVYAYSSGLQLEDAGASTANARSFAVIKDPTTGAEHNIQIKTSGFAPVGALTNDGFDVTNQYDAANLCFAMNGRKAQLSFAATSIVPTLELNTSEDCI